MKLTTKYVPITPYYMMLRQISDNIEQIRATQDGVERFFPMQFGGLFGQKTVLELEESMEMTDFDGGTQKNAGNTTKYTGGV